MRVSDLSILSLTAIQAALKAGEILTRGFGTTFEITLKPGRQNFVTEYDKAAESCIISVIREQFPNHNILAEESGYFSHSQNDILWIIDPLDGTTNFAHHIPIFTISIAAYQKDQGLCGVIYQPISHELFIAEHGKGAFLNGTRLKVSQTTQLEECLIAASLPYDSSSVPVFNIENLIQISKSGATLRNFGSAALALAYVAAGKLDAFWMYNLYPWDFAAGQLLIQEAGGELKCYEQKTTCLHPPSHILATNQSLHQILQTCLMH